jgi:hypothetical protein
MPTLLNVVLVAMFGIVIMQVYGLQRIDLKPLLLLLLILLPFLFTTETRENFAYRWLPQELNMSLKKEPRCVFKTIDDEWAQAYSK